MYKLNISKDSQYHTQRNNEYVPMEACNVTALIMALKSSGIKFDEGHSNQQPEDYFTFIMRSEEAMKKMKELAPWAVRQGYPPQEVHVMLEWGVNEKLVGEKVDYFSTNASIQDLVYNLVVNESASTLSTRLTSYGHVVTLVGFETNQRKKEMEHLHKKEQIDVSKIKNFIIDDPYGNYHANYESRHGNNVKMPMKDFIEYVKTENQDYGKWAHILKSQV